MSSHRMHSSVGKSITALHVLLVDDDFELRRAVATMLRAFGVADISQASDGEEALDLISRREVDLIITDWLMKPLDGASFLRHLRRIDNVPYCFLPVIVLTAFARPSLVKQAQELGANQLLVKPVTPERLLQQVRSLLVSERRFYLENGLYRMRAPGADPEDENVFLL